MTSDRELILTYLDGDEEAFGVFYRRYRRPLYVYLLSIVGLREIAEEIMQEIFFSLLSHLEDLDDGPSYRPYVFQAARNRAIDFLRREERAQRALERRKQDPLLGRQLLGGQLLGGHTDGLFSRSSSWDSFVDAEELEGALGRLPPEQRETIVLKAMMGLTFQEVGRLMGVPENTAVSRYRYGLQKMRVLLGAGECLERTG